MLGLEGHVPPGLSASGAQRVAGPPPSLAGEQREQGRGRAAVESSAPGGLSSALAAASKRASRAREAGVPGLPAPLSWDWFGALGSVRCHPLRDFEAPTQALGPPKEDCSQTIRGEARERETETCCRGQGSREEGTAVHARNSASDPTRQVPAGCEECGAHRARALLEPAPARERRAQSRFPPAPLCSHFPGRRASRLRPRPAPERRPHSAAAGWRAPRERAPRPRRRKRQSEGS